MYEVLAPDAAQALLNVVTFFGFVPEEVLSLRQLLFGTLGTLDGFQGIGVVAGVPRLCGDGHRGGGEVLHLLQLEVQALGEHGELGHVSL